MRLLVATTLLVGGIGCGFEHGQLEDDDTGADAGIGAGSDMNPPDDPPTTARSCAFPKPELRLCLEFNDGMLTPVVRDGSMGQLDPAATGLKAAMRVVSPPDPAVTVSSGSSIALGEKPSLEIRDEITIEAWVRPDRYQAATIVGNVGQYVLMTDGVGRVGCGMAGVVVFTYGATAGAAPFAWHHIACTFNGTEVRAYVDGSSRDCARTMSKISTGGTGGTKIAPNFTGDIDGVRIYAKELSNTDLCAHANQTGCQRSACDGDGPGGPGF